MTRIEAVSIVVSGAFILVATIALALMMVRQRLDDMAGPITEPPLAGAHRYVGVGEDSGSSAAHFASRDVRWVITKSQTAAPRSE